MKQSRRLICCCAVLLASCAARVEGDPEVGDTVEPLEFAAMCSDEHRSLLPTYQEWLISYAWDAVLQFQTGPTGERRRHWFGQLDSAQAQAVTERLYRIAEAVSYPDRRYVCHQDDESFCVRPGYRAWTERNRFDADIDLCERMWTDTDNQFRLEVLAHEHAHIAGARDLLDDYGIPPTCDASKAVAAGETWLHPEFAIQHAQNYACFIINQTGIPD